MADILKTISKKIETKSYDNYVEFIMHEKTIREENMQVPGNAFEGWAIVVHIEKQKKIKLEVIFDKIEKADNGDKHWNRFLYRAMKFSEQYSEWFELGDSIENVVEQFKNNLYKEKCVNNPPTKNADNTDRICDENSVEALLAEPKKLKKILVHVDNVGDKVYRQLPVGLFKGEKKKENAIFTYGHSAIDLWNICGDTINIIELKTQNPMIGIITEIFFYTNYIYDFVINKNSKFELSEPTKGMDIDALRGYNELYDRRCELKKVQGIMLADEYHSFIMKNRKKICDELNRNKAKIKYCFESYKIMIEKNDIVR